MVESCLPETVFRAWERSRSVEDSSPQDSVRSLDKLLCFLRNEVKSEEMIKLARTGFGASRVSHPRSQQDEPDCSTAAVHVNFQDNSGWRKFRCIFCDKPHNCSEYFSARKMPVEDKRKLLTLDAISITDPTEDAMRKHAHSDFLNQFIENLSVINYGLNELLLPFKFETQLPNNKSATFKAYVSKIDKQNQLNDYEVGFRQWEDLQIIEKVSKTEIDNFGYYLPHRPVIKQASQTMKMRLVFDASARDKNQPILNDCLNRDPNLIELIPDIIGMFRLYPIGLSSDIEKAFLFSSVLCLNTEIILGFSFLLLKKLKFTDTGELCLESVLLFQLYLHRPSPGEFPSPF
ncbi:integrase catalytic domain-containing protein [Trichonephila clavipes]|nr:integrase catalytic domain-containing protein [Trichonephila clavipes]